MMIPHWVEVILGIEVVIITVVLAVAFPIALFYMIWLTYQDFRNKRNRR